MTLEHDSPLPDPEAARAKGRAQRATLTRTAVADLVDRPDTRDPVSILENQSRDRVPELIPIRYQRMLVDAFAFFRGSAAIQATDLAQGPSSELDVQLCGDAHLANFGVFSSPEQRLVFDVDDFDETTRGPFEWDVKRLASSVAIAADSLGHSERQQARAVHAAVTSYRTSMREFARNATLTNWYATLDLDSAMSDLREYFTHEEISEVSGIVAAASGPSPTRAFAKLMTTVDGRPRIRNAPPLLVPLDELDDNDTQESLTILLTTILRDYSSSVSPEMRVLLAQFTPMDAARKVVGVGSVGMRCFILLLLGRDVHDPFFLQVKEATDSVVDMARGRVASIAPGDRVVEGQRVMQATSDLFLGSHALTYPDGVQRSFYIRQLYDNKASVDFTRMSVESLSAYARVCAWALARAHARTGTSLELAAYMGSGTKFDDAVGSYALAYRRRNSEDYNALRRAADEGRISVAT